MIFSNIVKSPNFNERIGFAQPNMIVLHYTGMKSDEDAIEKLCDPSSNVSAHYVIASNGEILHLVDEEKRAWHAGVSSWRGCSDINSASIGIEICNPGHEFGYAPFKVGQISSLIPLMRNLISQYNIKPWNIVGHSDVAPSRKQDPGEKFPWEYLAEQGIGLWPKSDESISSGADESITLESMLQKIGYNCVDNSMEMVKKAFCRRFVQDSFDSCDNFTEPARSSLWKVVYSIYSFL